MYITHIDTTPKTIPYQELEALRTVRLEDIPEEYRDIAEVLGMEHFLLLSRLCGGQELYIPREEILRRKARNREIRARFDGGNTRALARQFRLTQRYVRKIVNARPTPPA